MAWLHRALLLRRAADMMDTSEEVDGRDLREVLLDVAANMKGA